jgi:murein DD-endopeptidase MepM/ murein hydrolase activator NlpD
MAWNVSTSLGLMLHTTGTVVGYMSQATNVSAIIKPGDNIPVPVIIPNTPMILAAHAAIAPAAAMSQPSPPADAAAGGTAIWPIHGAVTTEFGASDWPYQLKHTGIDISDGQRSGVTPIHPFKAGKVVEVVHSGVSLGNHVVVDHGSGITSVYGHMYATAVQVGQDVDQSSVLGYEGSTGASTGPHVHFEIHLNGDIVNPRQYIPGQP